MPWTGIRKPAQVYAADTGKRSALLYDGGSGRGKNTVEGASSAEPAAESGGQESPGSGSKMDDPGNAAPEEDEQTDEDLTSSTAAAAETGSTSGSGEDAEKSGGGENDAGTEAYTEEDKNTSGKEEETNTDSPSQADTSSQADTASRDQKPSQGEDQAGSQKDGQQDGQTRDRNPAREAENAGGQNDGTDSGTSNTETGNTSASDPAASDAAAADATAQAQTIEEEPWMTAGEFNLAFRSLTKGAGSSFVPSRAEIVSKESEIDYEELGIGRDITGHRGHTTPINIRDEKGNEYTGVCVVPDDRGLPRWSTLPNVTQVTDGVMIRLYYYTMLDSYGEELAKSRGFGSNSKKVAVAACHEAMSMRYAELAGVEYDRPNLEKNLTSLVSAYKNGVASKALPDMNKVHIYVSGRIQKEGHWIQAYVFGFIEKDLPTSLVLEKTCSDPDMRQAYKEYYCLHETADGGPVNFRLYTDKACTKKAHVYSNKGMTVELDVITAGMSGKSGVWNQAIFYCAPGTYYLKELTTPRGYQVHEEPFGPYVFTEGQGMTIRAVNTPVYARAGIIKKDSGTGKALEGARYGMYADAEDARDGNEPVGVFTTGKDGKSNLLSVLAGKYYYVREISAPKGYKQDNGVYRLKAADSVSATTWTELKDEPLQGFVYVKKVSSDPAADTDLEGSPYSLEGAVYTLYDSDGNSVGTLKTGKDGISNELKVNAGSYTLRETTPSPGFKLDETVHQVTVPGGEKVTVESKEPPCKGKIIVRKHSSEEKEEKAPDTLPILGAVYTLYNSEEDAEEERAAAGTFLISADGRSNEIEVLAGKTYYVKETVTPEGYLPDEKIHTVKVDSLTETVVVNSEDRLIFGGVKVCKRDLETLQTRPLGGAWIEGTVLTIYNDGDLSVYADGKKILPGAEALTLVTGADGTAGTGAHALSYGKYRVEETTPPEGYTRKGASPVHFTVTENGKIKDLSSSADTSAKNRVMRGDFSIRKISGYTQKRMAGVTFEVTSYDRDGKEIEKHRFTTDENGYFDSTAKWAARQKTDTGRLWFGIDTEPDDSLGALPYGSYHIQEIEGDNNRGMKMFSDDFSVYAEGQTITLGNIENTLKPVLETELLDENGDHFADQKGMVTLTDLVTYGGMEEYIGKEVTFHGVIYVKETGKPLQIDGRTVECAVTRKILSPSAAVQLRFTFDASKAEGMTLVCFEYASEAVSETESPGSEDPGTETPGTETPGTETPGTETTQGGTPDYHDSTNGGKDIVSHTDLEDESQTVHLVSIETDAKDQLTGMHIGQAADGAVTVDHVTCRGLIPGQKYRVTGFLVDKSTGKPLKDSEGKDVTAEASFTAKDSVEIVDLTFTYDASLLEGTTVVAFERLYLNGKPDKDNPGADTPDRPGNTPDGHEPGTDTPIAVHEDPDDEDQSVHYPLIRTYAAAAAAASADFTQDGTTDTSDQTAEEMTKAVTADGKVIVRDHVTWKNLIPGRTYLLQGTLMRKDSGKPLAMGGEEAAARAQFKPAEKDGETTLDFFFDASGLFGDKEKKQDGSAGEQLQIVAFEELYISAIEASSDGSSADGDGKEKTDQEEKEYLIAEHKDLNDPAQTVLLAEPEKPDTPEEPEDTPQIPDKPGTVKHPEQPVEPDTTKTASAKKNVTPASPETVRSGSPVRTGDDTNIAVYLIPALLAAIASAGILIAKRRGKKH